MERMRKHLNSPTILISCSIVGLLLTGGLLALPNFLAWLAAFTLGMISGRMAGKAMAMAHHEGWREGVDQVIDCMPLRDRMELVDRLEEELRARSDHSSD